MTERERTSPEKAEKQGSVIDNLLFYGSAGTYVPKSKKEGIQGRYENMWQDAMAKRKKQLIAEGANPEDFADFADTDKEGSDVIDIAFQAIKTPIVAAMAAFETKSKARQKEEGKMRTAVDRNVRERIARRIAKKRVPKIGADNSSNLLSNRHFEAPIKDENMTPQRQKLASLCGKLKGRGVRLPVKDKKVPSDGIKSTKKTVRVSKPKLKISSAVRLFPKKQRTKLAAFLISKYAEKKANEASSHALEQFTKLADKGQAAGAPLGSLQQAYVADAVGAEASARAASQAKDHPDVEDSLINEMIARGAGYQEPLQRRIRHGASRLAETSGGRMMSAFDPTGLLSENPDANLTNLIMGAGKKNPEREELVKQRYAEVLKKFQAKLDPDAELTTRDTPWHRMQQGDLANLDSDIAGHEYMRSEKPWQYWLNPFDRSGPLTELGDRASRRMNAGLAYPDSTGGRFGMGLGTVASLGLLPLLTGGEEAQQSLRGSAAKNKIYADVATPELKKKRPKDGDGDGMINDGTPEEKKDEEKDAWDKTAEPIDFQHGIGRNVMTALQLTAGPAITGGTGAVIGALINALRNKDVGRGAMTGAITGAGAGLGTIPANMILSGLSNPRIKGRQNPGSGFDVFPTTRENMLQYALGSNAIGMGAGGVGGYQLAQYLHNKQWGKEEGKDEEKDEEKEAQLGRIAARGTVKRAGGLEDLMDMINDQLGSTDMSRFPVDVQALSPLQSAAIGGGGMLAGAGGGALIGALVNALKNKDVRRGAITGAMTGGGAGLGVVPGLQALAGLSNPPIVRDGRGLDVLPVTAGNAPWYMGGAAAGGAGIGGGAGYALAQKLQGKEEEKEAGIGRIAARTTVKQAKKSWWNPTNAPDGIPLDVTLGDFPLGKSLAHTAIGGGGGALIGAVINALRNKDIGRGAITGGLTGAGAGAASVPGARTAINSLPVTTSTLYPTLYGGGAAAAGVGGAGGYALSQLLQGKEEEEDKEKEAAFRVLANGARALARGETVKVSFDMDSVKKFWGGLKPWQQKSMIGGGAGLALGGLTGGLMGGGEGALYGAMAGGGLGALGGGLYDPMMAKWKEHYGKGDSEEGYDILGDINEFNKLKEEGLPKHPSEISPFSSYGSFGDENYDPNYSVEDITGVPGQRHENFGRHPIGQAAQGIGRQLADPFGLAQASSDAATQKQQQHEMTHANPWGDASEDYSGQTESDDLRDSIFREDGPGGIRMVDENGRQIPNAGSRRNRRNRRNR